MSSKIKGFNLVSEAIKDINEERENLRKERDKLNENLIAKLGTQLLKDKLELENSRHRNKNLDKILIKRYILEFEILNESSGFEFYNDISFDRISWNCFFEAVANQKIRKIKKTENTETTFSVTYDSDY